MLMLSGAPQSLFIMLRWILDINIRENGLKQMFFLLCDNKETQNLRDEHVVPNLLKLESRVDSLRVRMNRHRDCTTVKK